MGKTSYVALSPDDARKVLRGENVETHSGNTSHRITSFGDGSVAHHDRVALTRLMFERLDINGDGKLTKQELLIDCTYRDLREALALGFPGKDLNGIISELDEDGDGMISQCEFAKSIEATSSSDAARFLWG